MQFKVLKHKTLEDTYGVFHLGDDCEIWQRQMPQLLKSDINMEYLKKVYVDYTAYEQLDAYELVNIKIEILN